MMAMPGTDRVFDHTPQDRVVGAAEHKRIDVSFVEIREVLAGNELCRGMIDESFFGKRYKERTCFGVYLYVGIEIVDGACISVRADGGLGADDSDAFFRRHADGQFRAGFENAYDRNAAACFPDDVKREG